MVTLPVLLISDNKVIVSGKYAEPASLQLEAYREEYGRRIRESEVSVTVNSDNMINARAFLNPSAYDDMRVCLLKNRIV